MFRMNGEVLADAVASCSNLLGEFIAGTSSGTGPLGALLSWLLGLLA